jgi:phenylacetate-CoA ligase
VQSLGGGLSAEARNACREAWGVPLAHIYRAEEVGPLALQCPEHEHFHVQSEQALVEVLDAQGMACAPGETGRVVATPLNNFAMPLIRYEVGETAEVGAPCACGRGLPVLTRIMDRDSSS